MTVTKEITRLEKSSVKLSVTIGKDQVRSEYDGLLSEYTKTIQIPGFRKGKVPRDVLMRKFGDTLKGEALSKIVEKALDEVFSEDSLPRESRPLPYSSPQMQDEPKLDLDSDLSFSLVYDVIPQITVEKWQGLEAEVPDISIEEEDIWRELHALRERNAIVLDKDEGQTAGKDDVVTVDYAELDDADQRIEGSARQDFTFTLGSERNLYRFDEEITGMKKGESRTFSKTYAPDDTAAELAGTTKKLSVTLTALKVRQLPELDDDLAQDVDEKFKTLDDLKDSIRQRLGKDLELRLRAMKINALLEKIMETAPAEIPESMLKAELDSRWRTLARNFNTDVAGLNKILASAPSGPESIKEGWKPDAEKALHSRLVIETLIEDLKLEASDAEVEAELERVASESGTPLEEVKKYYEAERMEDYLKEQIKERKVLDLLLEKNTIKPGKKEKYVDLAANNG